MVAGIGHNSRTRRIFRAHGERGYTKLRNEFLQDDRISDEARGLVARLLSYPEYWEVTVNAIVQSGRAGRDKVYRMLKEAEKYGYIKPDQPHDQAGKFMRQMYLVSDDPQALIEATADEILAIEEAARKAQDRPLTENPETVETVGNQAASWKAVNGKSGSGQPLTEKPCTAQPFTANPTQRNKYKKEININTTRAHAREAACDGSPNKQASYGENFERFWSQYPRKEGKGAAYQAWKRLKGAERRRALEAIPLHAPCLAEKANRPEGNFCPHPRTWLSQRRFDDPPPSAGGKTDVRPPDIPEHVWAKIQAQKSGNGSLL